MTTDDATGNVSFVVGSAAGGFAALGGGSGGGGAAAGDVEASSTPPPRILGVGVGGTRLELVSIRAPGSGGHGPRLAQDEDDDGEDDSDEGVALFRASPIGRRAGGRLAQGALPQLASDLLLHAALLRGAPYGARGLGQPAGAGWGLSGHLLVELRSDGHGGVEGGVLQPGACAGVTDVVLYLRTSSENHAKGPGGEERPNLYRHLAVAVRAAEDLVLGRGKGEGGGEGDDGGGGGEGGGEGDGDPADGAVLPPLRGIVVAEVSSSFTSPMRARWQLGALRVAASRVIERKGNGAAVIVAPSPSRLGRNDLPEVVDFLTQDGARVVVPMARKLADEWVPDLVAEEKSGDFVSLAGLERVITAGSEAHYLYTARMMASIAVAWRMGRRGGDGAPGTYDDAARGALKGRFRGLRDAPVVFLSRVSPLCSILGDSAGSSSIESQFAFARLFLGDVLLGPWVGWSAQCSAGARSRSGLTCSRRGGRWSTSRLSLRKAQVALGESCSPLRRTASRGSHGTLKSSQHSPLTPTKARWW